MTGGAGDRPATLATSIGELELFEYRLRLGGREWSVLHSGEVLSYGAEYTFLHKSDVAVPYGVTLWPAAIALAHDLAARESALRGAHVLELGAGTGLPGIVASSFGARVVQTDRHELALAVCRRNGARNRDSAGIEYRLADWTAWDDDTRYDLIVGSDIIYSEKMRPHLRAIFDRNLQPGGAILLSDPFRAASYAALEAMEAAGWAIAMSRWTVGEADEPRAVGVFELRRPG